MCAATASPAAASSGPGGRILPGRYHLFLPGAGGAFMPLPEGSLTAAGLGLGLPAPDSRGHYQLLLSGRALADRYRRIYTAALSDRGPGGQQLDTRPQVRLRVPFFAPHMLCAPVCVCVCVSVTVCVSVYIRVYRAVFQPALDARW